MNRIVRDHGRAKMTTSDQTRGDVRLPGRVGLHARALDDSNGDGYAITYKLDQNQITVWFDPLNSNTCTHAEKINFHQVCKIIAQEPGKSEKMIAPSQLVAEDKADDWMLKSGWFLDAYTLHYPSYYIRPDGVGGKRGKCADGDFEKAELYDSPGPSGEYKSHEWFEDLMYDKKKNKDGKFVLLLFEFLTFATCEEGRDKETGPDWYEGLSWYWHIHSRDVHHGSKPGQWRGMSLVRKRLYGVPEYFRSAVDLYRSKRSNKSQ